MTTIAKNLKMFRIRANFSQQEVANNIQISRQSISKWENGKICPDVENIKQLSEIYSVSIDDIVQPNSHSLIAEIEYLRSENVNLRQKIERLTYSINKLNQLLEHTKKSTSPEIQAHPQ